MAKKDKKSKRKQGKKVEAPMPMPMFIPVFPGMMPPMMPQACGINEDAKKNFDAKAQKGAADVKSFLGKSFDMRKASVDSVKSQFDQFYAYMMEMQDSFAESLPEQLPTAPGMPEPPVTPKAVMKAFKEFEALFNEYIVSQMDARVDFIFQSQQKAIDMIPDAPKDDEAEAAEDAPEADAAEEAAEEEATEEEGE